MEQIYMRSRNHERLKVIELLDRELLRISLLPPEPPRKAGRRSQDDEN